MKSWLYPAWLLGGSTYKYVYHMYVIMSMYVMYVCIVCVYQSSMKYQNNILASIITRGKVKMSYQTMKNMDQRVSSQNKMKTLTDD